MLKTMTTQNPQELGFFGFSAWEKILSYMQSALRGMVEYSYVSSFWKNENLINNLNREYMSMQSSGYNPATPQKKLSQYTKLWNPETNKMAQLIGKNLNIPQLVVLAYFSAIFDLSATGKIPYQKWNPKGYAKSKKLQEKIETEKTGIKKITEGIQSATGTVQKILIPITIMAILATGLYIYKQFK